VTYGQPYNDGTLHSPGVLKIIQRQITVTATSDTKIYDGTTSSGGTPTITAGSLATGDSPNFTQVFDSPHVDATKVRPSGTANDGNSGKNYAYTFNDAAGTITPRPTTTVTADPQSKIYGEPDPTLTYHVLNNPPASYPLVAGDSFTGALTRDAGSNVGTYPIRQGTLKLSGDYTLTFVEGIFTIDPRPVTVQADAKSKTYGDTDPQLTYQAVNNPPASYPLIAGDSFSGDLTRDAGEDAGTYAIRQGTLSLSTNYTLTFKDAKLTINQKTVTAAVRAASKVYDGTTAATITNCALEGVRRADLEFVNCSATSASFADANIGTGKVVTVTVVLGGSRAFNYKLASTTVLTSADIVAPPHATITDGPANNSTIQTNSTSFSFSGTGGISPLTFECSLDAGTFAPCTSPDTLTGLSNGQHTFAVRAVDAAGNVDPSKDSRTFWALAVSWSLKAPFQDPRTETGVEGAAAGLIGGKIYVSHGYRGGTDTKYLSIYDITTDTWTHGGDSAPDASMARAEMAGGVAGGKYYAIGGRTGPSDAVEQFNPATISWSTVASLSQARGGLGAASWNDKIYAVGGRSGGAFGQNTIYGTFEVYNPATNTWTTLAALPTPVSDIYATVGYNGKIYVFGGATGPNTVISTVQIYNIATNTWTTGAPMPTARAAAMAGVIGGQIAVFGGFVPDPAPAFEQGTNLKVTEFYNPLTNTWTTGPDMQQAVSEISQGVTYDGTQIFSIGTGIFGPSGSVVQVLK